MTNLRFHRQTLLSSFSCSTRSWRSVARFRWQLLSRSVRERKPRRQLRQFEYSVDSNVDAAQYDFGAFTISCVGELLQRPDTISIDPEHGREIQRHFAPDTL